MYTAEPIVLEAHEVDEVKPSAITHEPLGSIPIKLEVLRTAPATPRSFISLNELERLCRENPTDYLIEGLLPANDVHVAVGDSGLGKTPWAYQLGLCVSMGRPFLGYPTRQGRVLYFDLENGPEAVVELAGSLCAYLGIERFPKEFLVRSDEAFPRLSEIIAEYEPSLVVIDTLRAFEPGAEKSNDEMGQFLSQSRSLARSNHSTILLLHHVRKPGENGVPALEETPSLEWLIQASGARALINQTNSRIAFDYLRRAAHPGAALVMKSYVKLRGESGPIYVERVCDSEGEPTGYRRMVGPSLLGNAEQETAYDGLPEKFKFKDAMGVYGKSDDPTRKWLLKCISVGIVIQTARGEYRKAEMGREHRESRESAKPAALSSLPAIER